MFLDRGDSGMDTIDPCSELWTPHLGNRGAWPIGAVWDDEDEEEKHTLVVWMFWGNYLWSSTQCPFYSIFKFSLPTSMASRIICGCFPNNLNNKYWKKAFQQKIRLEKKESDSRMFVYMEIRMMGKFARTLTCTWSIPLLIKPIT
eukprot:scaffold2524_cov159-Amphora_coffeaeformis.AAC.2